LSQALLLAQSIPRGIGATVLDLTTVDADVLQLAVTEPSERSELGPARCVRDHRGDQLVEEPPEPGEKLAGRIATRWPGMKLICGVKHRHDLFLQRFVTGRSALCTACRSMDRGA
jgi:hypothetical protein